MWLHSQYLHLLGAGILPPVGAQYQPFSMVGWKSFRSHPVSDNVSQNLGSIFHQIHPISREYYIIIIKIITTFEVTFPSSGPDIMKLLRVNQVPHPLGLGRSLNGDGVHAELPAVVPGPLPVPLLVPAHSDPGEMIILVEPGLVNDSCYREGYQ